ncbi:hypothetical protein EU556_01485 [Hymenobacter fodinae]|uniref:Secreted protein n=1 Tax=Hymenobacter fodinae TaxID=2510796 RepID=A0A4Z0PA98_9BACT|nr:hypothetical protein EU556_01485 [Hymenobacter fodinae]
MSSSSCRSCRLPARSRPWYRCCCSVTSAARAGSSCSWACQSTFSVGVGWPSRCCSSCCRCSSSGRMA